MSDELNNFPCRCGHLLEAHGDVPEEYGGGWHFDKNDKEYWEDPQVQPRPVCFDCGPYDCQFEQMTNLEYLEWKYNLKEINNNG